MKIISSISKFLSDVTGFKEDYLYVILLTFLAYLIIKGIKAINCRIYKKFNDDERALYIYNQRAKIFSTIIFIGLSIIIWEDYLKSFITVITFVSTAITLSLKDFVFNFFAGLYIKFTKPFEIEDRIEINDIKGDVVNLNTFSFELLELSQNVYGDQSTGRLVHLPNSLIFSSDLKNYVKPFKYIWNEIQIKIPLDEDVKKTKGVLYRIINQNDTIRSIPSKMANQIHDITMDYRIYFNKLKPIIYTKVVDNHIELYIRYLVHPKKARNVEDELWCAILNAYHEKEIMLLQ